MMEILRSIMRFSLVMLVSLTAGPVWAEDFYDPMCGNPFVNAVGPWDYTDPASHSDPQKLPIVDNHHFNSDVQQLLKGQTSVNILDDLDYVLRASPNHHRALYAMARLFLRNSRPPSTVNRTAECYFFRAMRFKPDDAMVRMIYGIYLAKKGDSQGALQRYKEALKIAPESSEAHYNLGLLYFELKEYKLANQHAAKAYQLGYPLPGLRNELQRHGAWDPSVIAPAPPQPDTSAAPVIPPPSKNAVPGR